MEKAEEAHVYIPTRSAESSDNDLSSLRDMCSIKHGGVPGQMVHLI